MTSNESTRKLRNTIITTVKLAGEGHQRQRHPKWLIMMLGANAEKPAMRLEEEEDPFGEDQCKIRNTS